MQKQQFNWHSHMNHINMDVHGYEPSLPQSAQVVTQIQDTASNNDERKDFKKIKQLKQDKQRHGIGNGMKGQRNAHAVVHGVNISHKQPKLNCQELMKRVKKKLANGEQDNNDNNDADDSHSDIRDDEGVQSATGS